MGVHAFGDDSKKVRIGLHSVIDGTRLAADIDSEHDRFWDERVFSVFVLKVPCDGPRGQVAGERYVS
jgi:hypothetical protein